MQPPNVIIIHGAYGHPEENWFGWLKRELIRAGIACYVPNFPTPQDQQLDHWLAIFKQSYQCRVHPNTILIGHSLGAAFAFKWLEQYDGMISTLIAVGAFRGKIGIEKFDAINKSFFQSPFDWERITNKCQLIYSYYGTNDPYVSKNDFAFIAQRLQATRIIVSKAGHFNSASGYNKFPHLLRKIKQLARSMYDSLD